MDRLPAKVPKRGNKLQDEQGANGETERAAALMGEFDHGRQVTFTDGSNQK